MRLGHRQAVNEDGWYQAYGRLRSWLPKRSGLDSDQVTITNCHVVAHAEDGRRAGHDSVTEKCDT